MKFNTLAIHAGNKKPNAENALNPPIFMTSTFTFSDTTKVDDAMSFKSSDYVYTRGNNPTLRLLEERVAALESGRYSDASSVAFASGMAAISSVLFSLLKPNDHIIIHRAIYGSAYSVITKLMKNYGIRHSIVNLCNAEQIESEITSATKVIYFETPANPNLDIINIKAVSEIAKKHSIKVVVDNTFATPFFQQPLSLGADVVVHSATKYLSGHGDVVAGVAVSKDNNYINSLKFDYMCEFGGVLSPFNAWLIIRGIKTLAIRMKAHEANAKAVALFLSKHNAVKKVFYPGLNTHNGHEIAASQMSGFGAIVAFELHGGLEAAKQFVNSCDMFSLAVSLGDCETLVELPSAMTHRSYNKSQLSEFGFTDSLVRMSVGLEDINDIIAELERMLFNSKLE